MYWVRIKSGASFEPNIGQDPYSTTFVSFDSTPMEESSGNAEKRV